MSCVIHNIAELCAEVNSRPMLYHQFVQSRQGASRNCAYSFRRNVERAVCRVVAIEDHELWSRRQTAVHMTARGVAVHILLSATPVSIRQLAANVGMDRDTLRVARNAVVERKHAPVVRRVLDTVAADLGLEVTT